MAQIITHATIKKLPKPGPFGKQWQVESKLIGSNRTDIVLYHDYWQCWFYVAMLFGERLDYDLQDFIARYQPNRVPSWVQLRSVLSEQP